MSDTLEIPAGVRIFGEAWAVVAGTGNKFDDINNPKAVVQVGAPGSKGTAEIGGIIFSTRGSSMFLALVVPSFNSDTISNYSCWCYRPSMEHPFKDQGRRRVVGLLCPPRRFRWNRAPTVPVPKHGCRKPPMFCCLFGRPPDLRLHRLFRRNVGLARRPRPRNRAR